MWESPIEIIKTDIQTHHEEMVMEAVLSCGINVNKEELIKALQYDRQQYEKGYEDAKAEQQWIPSSGRLPKKSGKYLVTVLDGIGKRTTTALYHPRPKSWTLTGRMAYWKVIAWMPLPEPYQGERKGEDE